MHSVLFATYRAEKTSARGRGMTLVELLAVIAILGLLVALLMPAVQNARESSRRLHCQGNLKQFGAAIQAHHDSQNCFPMRCATPGVGTPNFSSFVFLLPWLDQTGLYDQILSGTSKDASDLTFAPWTTRINTFICTSDRAAGASFAGKLGPSSYAANRGDWTFWPGVTVTTGTTSTTLWPSERKRNRGLLGEGLGTQAADVTDGLSNTVAYTERRIYTGEEKFAVPDAVWNQANNYSNQCGDTLWLLSTVSNGRFQGAGTIGWGVPAKRSSWSSGCAFYHQVNLVLPPNGPSCDQVGTPAWSRGLYTASSFHPQGVNVVMADGAIRFVDESIQAGPSSVAAAQGAIPITSPSPFGVWGALGTRCGGEAMTLAP